MTTQNFKQNICRNNYARADKDVLNYDILPEECIFQ